MTEIHRLLITFLLIVFPIGVLGSGPFQVIYNTFPNPGFETNPANSSGGWFWPVSDWVWDSSIAHSGTHSARVSRTSGDASASLYSANLSVEPSTIYSFTYWLRTQNATFWPSVSLYQFKPGYVQTGPRLVAHANIFGGTSAWQKITYRFQTMPDATIIQLRIYLPIATGTFWFDDFYLQEESIALYPYHPGFPVVANGSVFVSSPVVADIDNNGTNEVLIAGGSAVNGWNNNGSVLTGFPLDTSDKHIQSQVVVGDLDGNGDLEIAAGTKTEVTDGLGRVFIWHHTGALLNGWPKSVAWNTQYGNNVSLVSTIAFADIDGDRDLEILAGTSNNTALYSGTTPPPSPNLYAWHGNGSLVSGQWPTWHNTAGIYGCVAAGDLNGDGVADVEIARDHHYVNVYNSSGVSMTGWPVETYLNGNSGRYDIDEHIDFPLSAPTISDLDGDGEAEYMVTGFVGGPGTLPLNNSALLVFEPDGTRREGWETPALGTGILAPDDLSLQAPVVADLDQDGHLEIIVSTNDGWIRAYKDNKTVLWAFNYTQGAVLGTTEPAVGDIDGDGSLEVLFGTRVPSQNGGIYYTGPVGLWALKANGTVMSGFPLPIPTPGMFGAPTLDDFDGDGKLEILVAAREGEVIVWDTPTNFNSSRLPWPTGRHDVYRSGSYIRQNSLESSYKSVSPSTADQGEVVNFSIHVIRNLLVNDTLSLTDTIPSGLTYVQNSVSSSAGTAFESAGVIHWSSGASNDLSYVITYRATVTTSAPKIIMNNAVILNEINHESITRTVRLYANYIQTYLPILLRK